MKQLQEKMFSFNFSFVFVIEQTCLFFPYFYFDILEITENMVPCTFKNFNITFLNFSFTLKG